LLDSGWKETISPRLPEVITSVLPSLYKGVLAAAPDDIVPTFPSNPTDFDWPVHTGGTSILRSIEKAMGIGKEHTKASWEVYQNQGNTSSSSVLCVLDMSRRIQEREWCISVGFGPGLCGEALLLRRIRRT
jgi:type III polyketide synthase